MSGFGGRGTGKIRCLFSLRVIAWTTLPSDKLRTLPVTSWNSPSLPASVIITQATTTTWVAPSWVNVAHGRCASDEIRFEAGYSWTRCETQLDVLVPRVTFSELVQRDQPQLSASEGRTIERDGLFRPETSSNLKECVSRERKYTHFRKWCTSSECPPSSESECRKYCATLYVLVFWPQVPMRSTKLLHITMNVTFDGESGYIA